MHSIDSSSDPRAASHSGASSGSRAASHSGDPDVGGAGLGPAGTTDAAVGASSVYLRTLSDPFALPAGGAPRSLTAVGSPLPLPRDQDQHRRTGEAMR